MDIKQLGRTLLPSRLEHVGYRGYQSATFILATLRYFRQSTINISYRDIKVTYDITEPASREWFLPRYGFGRIHEPTTTQGLTSELAEDTVFYDVGANVGFYTVLGAHLISDGEVHGFEMDPTLVKCARKSLDHNSVSATLTCGAVGQQSGDIISFNPHGSNRSTNQVTDGDLNQSMQAVTLSIDDYCLTNSEPDVLKIDVEGYERQVLLGAKETLNSVRTVMVEVHPSMMKQFGDHPEDVWSLLTSKGFDCWAISNHRKSDSEMKPIEKIDFEQSTMLYCTRDPSDDIKATHV